MAEEKDFEEEYKKIKSLLNKGINGKFNQGYIQRQLHEKENLRKVFLAVIQTNPSRISEVYEISLLSKPTCYTQLHQLMSLRIVDRLYVLPIINGTIKNDAIRKKYEDWTRNMPEGLKRYYLSKTSYWVLTDYGKKFCSIAYDFDQEFRDKSEEKKDG